MSSKENNAEVAVDKVTENSEKGGGDVKAEVKGTKRPAEVSTNKSIVTNTRGLVLANARRLVCIITPRNVNFLRFVFL
jgi:hypothetical protein